MNNGKYANAGSKKALVAVLIIANVIMLAIGIFTIPPNLLRAAKAVDTPPVSARNTPTPDSHTTPIVSAPTDTQQQRNRDSTAQPKHGSDPSTYERPDLGDFLWYSEDVYYNGIPTDAALIENFQDIAGGWKGLILYDPEDAYGMSGMEFLNAQITGTAKALVLNLDWYMVYWANEEESIDETETEDGFYTGIWQNRELIASDEAVVRLTTFYELYGTQYAVGEIETLNDIPAFIALVRP